MRKDKYKKSVKVCGDCIHEAACNSWNIGTLSNADATSCINYETLRESNAYFIGYREGKNEKQQKG